jgi:hypothetical protein
MIQQHQQSVTTDHTDLIGAFVSSALSTIVIRYVSSVQHPVFGHLVLALFAVAGFLAAFLLIGRSKAPLEVKAGSIVGAAVVCGICFAVISYLV